MDSKELRQKFLKYFETKGHKVVPSSSLIPAETDPSVLFTTAGMHQFKRYYSEPEAAPSVRIATSQKCVRTGDIDEVGDNTHLTFFEMLGNFSFGYNSMTSSYFKGEAIEMAWDFLTNELKFEKSRLHATYFKGENGVAEDLESKKILETIEGLPKIIPQGFDDNFWSLGTENSPGGPTVEFYIDGIEIWNLVFNEYIFQNGKYAAAEYKGVDTGMGLERLLAVINDFENVYRADLFWPVIEKIREICAKNYEDNIESFRIISDHAKAAVFLINDGVLPSNKERGYVLRRLIRRAVVKAEQLGISGYFISSLAQKIFEIYDGVYFDCHPEHIRFSQCKLREGSSSNAALDSSALPQNDTLKMIKAELDKEESKFRHTLKEGLKLLNSQKEIDGKILFNLYQSYGLPLEISVEEAKRLGRDIDNTTIQQYNNLLLAHQEKSRTASAGMFKGGLAEAGEITTKYHTATHLLLAALRQVLGEGVFQKGSNITAERMRFDFSYPDKMTPEEIKTVEDIVNEKITENLPVILEEMPYADAKKSGAMGVFESKYGDKVKVYSIGSFSREICGGPHVKSTAELGHFKIQKEESSSAGVRRIKAILG